jgi:PAS domain S-box-containing protein
MQADGQQQPLLGQLPTTIEMALLPSTESRVITEPEEPFRILHVNHVWCHVCGYDAEEVIGETCAVLQGPGTCRATLGMLKQALNFKRNFAVQLLNYTKQGKPFMNTLQVTPLVDSQGRVTHYLGVVIARSLDGTGVPMSVSDPTTNPSKLDALHHRSERPKELSMKAAEPSHSLAPQQRHEMPQYPTGGVNNGQSRRVQQKLEPQPSAFENGNMSLELLERGDDAGGASTRVPPFLTKLYEILTAESADIVAFNPGVASFTIQNPTVFAKEVLPRYFKHNKLGSFSQQLHTYGFRRRANASSLDASIEFSHDQYTGPPANRPVESPLPLFRSPAHPPAPPVPSPLPPLPPLHLSHPFTPPPLPPLHPSTPSPPPPPPPLPSPPPSPPNPPLLSRLAPSRDGPVPPPRAAKRLGCMLLSLQNL